MRHHQLESFFGIQGSVKIKYCYSQGYHSGFIESVFSIITEMDSAFQFPENVYAISGEGYKKRNRLAETGGITMQKQRITVGYVELTVEESEQLFDKVRKDKGIEGYAELQGLMDDFDSRVIEPVEAPLAEVLGEEAPEEESDKGTRFIEVFNKLEEDSLYRIKASKQH